LESNNLFGPILEAVDLLLARGAAIDAQTEDGKTIVHFAVVGNFRTVCQFLLAQGVDSRALDLAKDTVWDVVEKYGRVGA
jgi:ankyrin repeat protein